jgi:hypothetical protein
VCVCVQSLSHTRITQKAYQQHIPSRGQVVVGLSSIGLSNRKSALDAALLRRRARDVRDGVGMEGVGGGGRGCGCGNQRRRIGALDHHDVWLARHLELTIELGGVGNHRRRREVVQRRKQRDAVRSIDHEVVVVRQRELDELGLASCNRHVRALGSREHTLHDHALVDREAAGLLVLDAEQVAAHSLERREPCQNSDISRRWVEHRHMRRQRLAGNHLRLIDADVDLQRRSHDVRTHKAQNKSELRLHDEKYPKGEREWGVGERVVVVEGSETVKE